MIVKKFFYVLTATAMLVAWEPTEPKDPNETVSMQNALLQS